MQHGARRGHRARSQAWLRQWFRAGVRGGSRPPRGYRGGRRLRACSRAVGDPAEAGHRRRPSLASPIARAPRRARRTRSASFAAVADAGQRDVELLAAPRARCPRWRTGPTPSAIVVEHAGAPACRACGSPHVLDEPLARHHREGLGRVHGEHLHPARRQQHGAAEVALGEHLDVVERRGGRPSTRARGDGHAVRRGRCATRPAGRRARTRPRRAARPAYAAPRWSRASSRRRRSRPVRQGSATSSPTSTGTGAT